MRSKGQTPKIMVKKFPYWARNGIGHKKLKLSRGRSIFSGLQSEEIDRWDRVCFEEGEIVESE
jgi:hypothetical protein